nr:hypothetical protein [Thiocapsa marina]
MIRGSVSCGLHVCLREIIALIQKRGRRADRQGVGKAVAVIESCGVSTLTESAVRVGCRIGHRFIQRDRTDSLHAQKLLGALDPGIAEARLDHQEKLGAIGCTESGAGC